LDPDLPADPQVDGKLAVREENELFLVVREEDPDDWLVRFDKGDGFPARAWAENMVRVYNRRLRRRSAAPPTPPGTRALSATTRTRRGDDDSHALDRARTAPGSTRPNVSPGKTSRSITLDNYSNVVEGMVG
jgi:hypothetical protein